MFGYFKKTLIGELYPTAMRHPSVALVVLCCSSFITEALREELHVAEINPQDIKSQALLTSGVHLGDFPLPSYLKEVTFLNFMFSPIAVQGSSLVNGLYGGVRRPGMILAGLALLGAGAFLFLNEIDALPEDLSLPFIPAQKVNCLPFILLE